MAGQLNIKLLVASVHNLIVLLISLILLFFSWFFQISGAEMNFKKMLFCVKKYPVRVVISILQAFNCRCLENFVHNIYFFFLIQSQDPLEQGHKTLFNHVLLEKKLFETKREK